MLNSFTRYFGMMILDSLHRGMAVEVWSKLQDTENAPSLDQAFGAFDMFVLHDQPQDLDYIDKWFNEAAHNFRLTQENWDHMSTRSKALALVRWLRLQGFEGIQRENDYRNFRNCMIGHAISDPEHPSLPLVSSAIFSSVATRLGLDAACCNAPIHVHAVVSSPPGFDLDGNPLPDTDSVDKMYLDPYTSSQEIRQEDLDRRRAAYTAAAQGVPFSTSAFFDGAPVHTLVERMANNLKTSYTVAKRLPEDSPMGLNLKSLRAGDPEMNMELCLYSVLWAQLLSTPPTGPEWDVGLDFFLNRFALQYPEDHWIVERFLAPLYDRFVGQPAQAARHRVGWENVREILKMLANLDGREPALSRRYTQEIRERVLYRIGQVFRHRRYGYVGVINGWAAAGLASLPTPHYVPPEEGEEESRGEWHGMSWRRGTGSTYYTCL
jgi:F-box protein 21